MWIVQVLHHRSTLVDDWQWPMYQICVLPNIAYLLCGVHWLHDVWVLVEYFIRLIGHSGLPTILLKTMLTHTIFRIPK